MSKLSSPIAKSPKSTSTPTRTSPRISNKQKGKDPISTASSHQKRSQKPLPKKQIPQNPQSQLNNNNNNTNSAFSEHMKTVSEDKPIPKSNQIRGTGCNSKRNYKNNTIYNLAPPNTRLNSWKNEISRQNSFGRLDQSDSASQCSVLSKSCSFKDIFSPQHLDEQISSTPTFGCC